MAANKGAPRRKLAAPESGGAKKKPTDAAKKRQTVAAKRKHVRELAKAGRWSEIERLYGKKIVTKAKTYVETQGVKKKTPLEIANEILIKNGYLPCVSDTAASPILRAPIVHQTAGSSTRACGPERIIATAAPDSPVKLTKEQQKRIETRRQEALERRRRVQQVARTCVHPPPAVIQPSRSPDEEYRRVCQAVVSVQEQCLLSPQTSRKVSSSPDGQQQTDAHRVVTVESSPRTNVVGGTKHAQSECFWDDLEAAAEIVQWENGHMAEAALEPQVPATKIVPDEECSGSQQSSHHRRELQTAIPNQPPPAVISFSQELLAAADIIQWEKEHESLPEVPGTLSVKLLGLQGRS